jgi:endonuclease YncB( thermonuclease family)
MSDSDPIKLEDCTIEVPLFTLKGKYLAKIVKVHDGDTVHGVIEYYECFTRFVLRLDNIDTAEMTGGTIQSKELAIKARDALSSMILNKIVQLEITGFDKYGRSLAIITCNNECVNQKLIDLGLAKVYDGGAK